MEEIFTLITNVGVPSALVIILMWFIKDSYLREQEKTREVLNDLKETIVVMTTTVETLTKHLVLGGDED